MRKLTEAQRAERQRAIVEAIRTMRQRTVFPSACAVYKTVTGKRVSANAGYQHLAAYWDARLSYAEAMNAMLMAVQEAEKRAREDLSALRRLNAPLSPVNMRPMGASGTAGDPRGWQTVTLNATAPTARAARGMLSGLAAWFAGR